MQRSRWTLEELVLDFGAPFLAEGVDERALGEVKREPYSPPPPREFGLGGCLDSSAGC